MKISTADLFDDTPDRFQLVEPIFRIFGGRSSFHGEIFVIAVDHDFLLVKQTLQTQGKQRVLVIDGGGALDCALLGDRLAGFAIDNDWTGIVVNGCIRDSETINTMDIGVRAINTCPARPSMSGGGTAGGSAEFAGVKFLTGDYLYADQDGMLLAALS